MIQARSNEQAAFRSTWNTPVSTPALCPITGISRQASRLSLGPVRADTTGVETHSATPSIDPSRRSRRAAAQTDTPLGQALIDQLDQMAGSIDALADQNDRRTLEQWAELGLLAAAAAHEINGLLTPITGYAELALSSPGNDRLSQRALEAAAGSGKRAAEILDAVLELGRGASTESGDRPLLTDRGCTPQDVVAAWESLAASLGASSYVSSGVAASIDPAARLPIALPSLRIAAGNLLRNAIKVSPETRVHLTMTQTASQWMIAVQDDGPGVPEHLAASLFDWGVTGGALGGYGIGLPLARALIRRAGGDLELHPAHGNPVPQRQPDSFKGAHFVIKLPVANG